MITFIDREKSILTYTTKRIVFVLCMFILFYLVSFLVDPYSDFWRNYFHRSYLDIIAEWLVSLLNCFLVAEASLVIHHKLNKTLLWTEKPVKRLIIETGFNICAVLLFITLNFLCMYLIYKKSYDAQPAVTINDIRETLQWVVVSLVISFVVMAINTGNYLINNWKNTQLLVIEHKLRAAELRQSTVEAELNTLKLQIDPHFIFNNLSVLSELILEDPQLGYQFSENFSKVYRFLLVNSKKNLISLEDEMKFLKAYIFLIQHRIGAGVNFEIAVDEVSGDFFLPPLTLQLLVENAIKHNKTNKTNPLTIKIYSEDIDKIVVENLLSPIENNTLPSTGMGLSNISSRFQLLSRQVPEILVKDGYFKVIIHLMKYDK